MKVVHAIVRGGLTVAVVALGTWAGLALYQKYGASGS